MRTSRIAAAAALALGTLGGGAAVATAQTPQRPVPPAVLAITGEPAYAGATWGLRVVDLESGGTVSSLGPDSLFFTGSVRKLFSVAEALDSLGPGHRFRTPIHRRGTLGPDGVLRGDLVLVASGDLTLGGRTTRSGDVAFTDFDHTESNSLGSSILTRPAPLAGIRALARRVAASGVRRVEGDVVVDDRLFRKFRVPNGNVLITPITVNDNLVDVTIRPTRPGRQATVSHRPHSEAFRVRSTARTVPRGRPQTIRLETSKDGRTGFVRGSIPVGYRPPLPGVRTLVQTFTIADPSAYARTVLIEALRREGVQVDAPAVARNRAGRLPAGRDYPARTRVARYVSPPYSQYAKLILKVSHNYGANLSLMYAGLTQGARTRRAALAVERRTLVRRYGLPADGFRFPTNGSGSPDSQATPGALMELLVEMSRRRTFEPYFEALPALGVDGSLATVGRSPRNPVIAPAFGKVFAKTGTTIDDTGLKAQNFAGYFDGVSGRRYAYVVYVNDVTSVKTVADVIKVIEDEGEISALLRADN
jgi:D-alanyl-D-alanine carboxypeptidase/D-alanyl-D-alanine-endopeptidase (penicillin-binding protein 4)